MIILNTLYIIFGICAAALFFLNLRAAAELLCKTIFGLSLLVIYNMAGASAALTPIGINAVSALVVGVLGLPGGVMLYAIEKFL